MWPFRNRTSATYAAPKPKRVEISPREVAELVALVGNLYADNARTLPDDPEIRSLIRRCVVAREQVRKGHSVSVFIPGGEL